jgi:hypothetical protein
MVAMRGLAGRPPYKTLIYQKRNNEPVLEFKLNYEMCKPDPTVFTKTLSPKQNDGLGYFDNYAALKYSSLGSVTMNSTIRAATARHLIILNDEIHTIFSSR